MTETADREIVITRLIDAPRDLVFEVFTEVRHLAQWWGPDGFTTTTRSFDFRAGGTWDFVMHGPDGTDYQEWITWTEIVPPERITLRHGESRDDLDAFESILAFEPQGTATRIVMRTVFPTRRLRDQAVSKYHAIEGGEQTLGHLAAYVARITTPKVFFSVSMSLDGFSAPESMDGLFATPAQREQDPRLDHWMAQWTELQAWIFPLRFFRENLDLGAGGEEGRDNDIARETYARTGASIMGRRMFDLGEASWPEEAPFHTPVYVITHERRDPWERPGGTTFHFVDDGIESALAQARAAIGTRDVRIAGGRETIVQYLNAGLVDECRIALAPVLFGAGTRLFDDPPRGRHRAGQRPARVRAARTRCARIRVAPCTGSAPSSATRGQPELG
jgi:uncharacterized protein YndB with AHSA1/START domain/dihydrofolate reductase